MNRESVELLTTLPAHLGAVERRWVFVPPPPHDVVQHVADALQLHDALPVVRVLAQRGIHTYEDARRHFSPTPDDLHDPFQLCGMDKAAERLALAREQGEHVLVYGDYDVDGTTSVALFDKFFAANGWQHSLYIPDRYTEGYGVSGAGVQTALERGAAVFLALDCGTQAVDEAAALKAAGIDFIVCDHHQPGPVLPEAFALLNPLQPGCEYPFKHLSGCGIGFKLVQALVQQLHLAYDAITELSDLVALSTACDLVPMVGENRVLCHLGQRKMRTAPSPGIRALMATEAKPRRWEVSDMVFALGPRVNAAGRLSHALLAADVLRATFYNEELELAARHLDELNRARQAEEAETLALALDLLANDSNFPECYSIVLWHPAWNKGIVGIVASKLVERFHRPTLLLAPNDAGEESPDSLWTGSGRSIPHFDLLGAIQQCAPVLHKFGGHTHAAGLSLPASQLPRLRQLFEEAVRGTLAAEALHPTQRLDTDTHLAELTPKVLRLLDRLEPFGPGNRRPVFHLPQLEVVEATVLKHLHVRFLFRQGAEVCSGIGFNLAERWQAVSEQLPRPWWVDVAAVPETETAPGGRTEVRLRVVDIRVHVPG
jgi:single-stranded-DNA-specific exonuclease